MFHFGDPLRSPNSVPTTPPGPAPPTPTGYFSASPPYSPSSSGPQDVSLEPAGSIPFSFGLRSPGKSSPLRGRNMKDYEEQLEQLKKDNFSLKLRIYFLEEKMSHKGFKEDKEELHKANIEMKVETEALKKQLCDKQELLRQAAHLLTNMENQYKEELQAIKETHERESQELRNTIEGLKKDLEEYAERAQQDGGDLTSLCGLAFNNLGGDVDSRLIEGSKPRTSNTLISKNSLQGVFSMQDPSASELEERSRHAINHSLKEAPEVIPESAKNKIKELEEEVEILTKKVKNLQETLNEKEQTSKALQEDIDNLKKEIEDRDEKVSDLEYEVNEKDQKVDQLMQELETRHLEIKDKNSKIQNLHDDLNKVEPQIEVKVQEIIEKDKIIEEKTEQLQQQNKILVEIQITLDEKQKQISELEESLATTKQRFEKLNHDFEFSLRTIKEMSSEISTRDKEIDQLKKEVKRKEKKVKDLLDQLREATDMLKKAKWEAETSGGQDSVKEMVEEENERLWAELEQQKVEIRKLREQKEALNKEMQEKEKLLQKEKLEMQEKLQSLQSQIANEGKGERDKISEIKRFKEVMESRENLLRNQEEIIEKLKTELAKAKDELAERKEELRDLKNELSKKNNDMHEFFTKELLGRSKEFCELQSKLLSIPLGKDNQLEAFKLFLEANPINVNLKPNDSKEPQNHFQVRSSSLPKISETVTKCVENANPPSEQSPKSGRSNSFSLLENLLYANMGQKVYNTNQTFNTYVLSSEVENNEGEIIPIKDVSTVPSCEMIKGEIRAHKAICKEVLETHLKNANVKESKNASTKTEYDTCTNSNTESHAIRENDLEMLYEEVSNIRNEAQALRKDREILTEKVSALQTLNQQLLNGSGQDNMKYFKIDGQNLQGGENDTVHLCSEQINALKGEFKDTKQKVSLQMLQVASSKYQESLKNYKEEIISLRKRLADSHNACNLLRNRLEELLDFFEQILDMDRNGIINLSHLSTTQKSSLRKSLNDSRSLSLSLSHSLMIGMDSVLNDSVATQNDAEASRFCLPSDTFAEEFELTHHGEITMPDDDFNYSELSKPEPTNDFFYYSFAAKIHSQIDDKSKELDALALKMNEIYSTLKSKDEEIEAKTQRIIELENQIARLKEEISVKNHFSLQSHTSGSSGTVVEQRKSSSPFDVRSNSSLHLSVLEHSAESHDLDAKIADKIFILPRRESSCSDVLPPPLSYISSSDDHVALLSRNRFSNVSDSQVLTRSTSQSDNVSVYSTDVAVKNLPHCITGDQDLTSVSVSNIQHSTSRINLEQPLLPPSFAVASPSESEAWSEPDRNVSLARIGLETCNIVSGPHDRSISRSRMTRSAPFTSESEGEANFEEVKEGSVGLGNTVAKSKRRSDASEIKRLTNKLKNLEQLTVTLKEELHIYQTLFQRLNSSKSDDKYQQVSLTSMKDKNLEPNNQTIEEIMQQNENDNVFIPAIPSSLLNEIRSLRMKLEEAITKNDLLRDQLEAALSGYLSEETKSHNVKLASLQQELMCNQEKIIIASKTEQQLRLLVKENESKMFELGERLADYITKNQKQEKVINELTRDLHNVKEKLVRREEELENTQAQIEESNGSSKTVNSQIFQMEANINSLKAELKKLQQLESDKGRRIEEQDKYISALEEAKKDYESKLLEQDSAIKELCQSITLLQQETNKSSMSNQLVVKLKEALQKSEGRLLEITKERFALLGDKARLQAQLASATTHANLLKKEVRDLSVSDDGLNSESGSKEITEKLQSAEATIKELLKCKDLWLSEKQTLQNEMHLTREENSALRNHLDHLLSRETVSNSSETVGVSSVEFSYSNLKEQYVALGISYNNILSEKNEIEGKLLETQEKEKELKATIKAHEMRIEELLSKLDAERYLTKNLQIQIKRLQLDSTNLKVPSDYDCGLANTDTAGSGNKSSKIKGGKENLSPWEKSLPPSWTWGEDKENRYTRTLSRATHSLPIIDDETTSGDSPDLGIGSDGQFSSFERLSITKSQRVEQNKKLLTLGDVENENVVRRLCSDPSHRQLLSEINQLREEKEVLHSELGATKESLKESIGELTKANQRTKSIEKNMMKEFGKTYYVLQKSNKLLSRAKESKSVKQNPSRTQNDQKPQTG